MPFNEKGEFIRAETRSAAGRDDSASIHRTPPASSAGRVPVTSCADRPASATRSPADSTTRVRDMVLVSLLCLLLLAALIGGAWYLFAFHRWILLGLGVGLVLLLRWILS